MFSKLSVLAHEDHAGLVGPVGVEVDARARRLDPPPLGEPEVAALADDAGAQLGAVDANRVVGLVADLGVLLDAGLDVGAAHVHPDRDLVTTLCLGHGGD